MLHLCLHRICDARDMTKNIDVIESRNLYDNGKTISEIAEKNGQARPSDMGMDSRATRV